MGARIGPYEIEDLLGRGALAAVYTAKDSRDGRPVAMKVVRKDAIASSEREDVLRRFRRGIEIAQRLRHPCVVDVHDWGEDEDCAWLAMDLVLGAPLATLADPMAPVSLQQRIHAFLQLLDVIGYFHDNGVLLRDLTPINVLVIAGGGVKLTELGQASEPGDRGVGAVGIPSYTAPEQLIGDAVDERADLYAAGTILFHLLTGRPPYPGPLAEVLQALLAGRVPRASAAAAGVPAVFNDLLLRAMAPQPDDRFDSAATFAAAVRDALAQVPATADTVVAGLVLPAALMGDSAAQLRMRIHLLLVRAMEGNVSPYLEPLRETLAAFMACADAVQGDRLAGILIQAFEALREIILANAPVPCQPTTGRRPDWMDAVHLFDMVRVVLHDLGRGAAVEPQVQEVARTLRVTALMYLSRVNRLVFSADHIEMESITANLMRLDILQWALEVLNDRDAVCDLRISSRMIAGQVLRKVSATIRGFTEDPDELARFDVAHAVVAIEDIIVLAERVLEDDPTIATDDKAYAKLLGRDVVFDFTDSVRQLVVLTAEELARQVGAAGCDLRGFAGNLRQIGRLYRFAVRVESVLVREVLRQLGEEAEDAIHSLAADTVAAVLEVGDEDLPRQALLNRQLTAIHDLAQELGWHQFTQDLMAVLRHSLLDRHAA